jgi:hypothetical protein
MAILKQNISNFQMISLGDPSACVLVMPVAAVVLLTLNLWSVPLSGGKIGGGP